MPEKNFLEPFESSKHYLGFKEIIKMLNGEAEAIWVEDNLDYAQIYSYKSVTATDLTQLCIDNKKDLPMFWEDKDTIPTKRFLEIMLYKLNKNHSYFDKSIAPKLGYSET